MPDTDQPALLPQTPPTYQTLVVKLSDLAPNELIEGPDPDRDLIESVRTYGFIDALTLTPVEGKSYRYAVLDGGRRTKAARQLIEEWRKAEPELAQKHPNGPVYLSNVPARVPEVVEGDPTDVLALQKHATRKRNPIMEYQRVKRLLRNHTLREVARRTGFSQAEISRLLRLDNLPIAILEGASEGRVSMGQAFAIAALPQPARERLEESYRETKRLKTADIEAERHVRVTHATKGIDWGAIQSVPSTTGGQDPASAAADVPEAVNVAISLADTGSALLRDMLEHDKPGAYGTFEYAGTTYQIVIARVDQTIRLVGEKYHVERVMLAADGDPSKIGCTECSAFPGDPCRFATPEQERRLRFNPSVIQRERESYIQRAGDIADADALAESGGTVTLASHVRQQAQDAAAMIWDSDHFPENEGVVLLPGEGPLPTVRDMRLREAEASVRLDGETQVVGVDPGGSPSVSSSDYLPEGICEHHAVAAECQQQPCKRKRQKREFARRKRAAAPSSTA